MSIPVLNLGLSGTGKSYGLHNFKRGEIAIVNVMGKPYPFREQLETATTRDVHAAKAAVLNDKAHNAIMVDDFGYLITEIYMRYSYGEERKKDQFEVYKIIGGEIYRFINEIIEDGRTDRIVYLTMHTDLDSDNNIIPATIGKLLNEKINLVGMFSIVLLSQIRGGKYGYVTRGVSPAKTPPDMFSDEFIDNDLKAVDSRIREYWNLASLTSMPTKKGGKNGN